MNLYTTADADRIQLYFIFIYNFYILQQLLQLLDPCFDISLLVLGRIIFRVLRKVTLLTGLLDLLRNFPALIYLQILQLCFQLLQTAIGQNLFLCHDYFYTLS